MSKKIIIGERDTATGYDFKSDRPLPITKAIREHCLLCCGGRSNMVRGCDISDCHLWPYRLGRKLKGGKDE